MPRAHEALARSLVSERTALPGIRSCSHPLCVRASGGEALMELPPDFRDMPLQTFEVSEADFVDYDGVLQIGVPPYESIS